MQLIWDVVIGMIAGWATGRIMKGAGYGPLMNLLLGIVGGIVGGWVLGALGFYTTGGFIPSVLVAVFGAVILVALANGLKRA